MAKRELSSTLKNLKFMQRATQKGEKAKEAEEIRPDGNFVSLGSTVSRKCVVIVEGDPHPGDVKGRMSFLNFNPSVDKMNEEDTEPKAQSSSSGEQSRQTSSRETSRAQNGASESVDAKMSSSDSDGEYKRKKTELDSEVSYPTKSQNIQGKMHSSPSWSGGSQKKVKRDKLDWNLLRPPKSQGRKV